VCARVRSVGVCECVSTLCEIRHEFAAHTRWQRLPVALAQVADNVLLLRGQDGLLDLGLGRTQGFRSGDRAAGAEINQTSDDEPSN